MKETHLRSLIKGLSWRAAGTIDTIFISFLITGKITTALSIGGVEVVTKVILYYLHERAWSVISWGKQPDNIHEAVAKQPLGSQNADK